METSNKRNTYITVAVLVALVLIVVGAMAFTRQGSDTAEDSSQSTQTQSTQPAQTTSDEQSGATASAAEYKNGTYTATGEYSTPGGRESIDVSLTVENGVVTESTAEGSSDSGRAATYQRDFEQNYKQSVVGKKLEEISLSRVSGSSLTSQGFNDALDQIAQQAKA